MKSSTTERDASSFFLLALVDTHVSATEKTALNNNIKCKKKTANET